MLSHCQQARYVHQFVHQLWAGHGPPPVPTYIYTGCDTDWVETLVNTISCRLVQSNGSLTCPFAVGVTVGVHNEGVDISIPLRWMTKMTRMTRNLKSRPWEWLAEVYGNLVIVVILVMEGVRTGQHYVSLPCQSSMTGMTVFSINLCQSFSRATFQIPCHSCHLCHSARGSKYIYPLVMKTCSPHPSYYPFM